ncbi:MAG TPA: hypothetical protein VKF40_26120 [Burkholderiales bacterium]|nr:hypothetical protein [Burkholderiales bacterium]
MRIDMIPAVAAALLLAAPAGAVNVNVFKDAPITRLNAEEVKEFSAFVNKALDDGKEGATLEWKAPKTTFTSKVTPGKSFDDGKLKCREATIESDSHDRFQRGNYTFCRGDKGNWGFRTPTRAKASKQ